MNYRKNKMSLKLTEAFCKSSEQFTEESINAIEMFFAYATQQIVSPPIIHVCEEDGGICIEWMVPKGISFGTSFWKDEMLRN